MITSLRTPLQLVSANQRLSECRRWTASCLMLTVVWCVGMGVWCAGMGRETIAADEIRFERVQLSNEFHAEGGTYGDLNGDGKSEVIVGPWIYWGPDFETKSQFYDGQPVNPVGYSENFLMYTEDVDRDQQLDIIVLGFPGKESWWFRNPGKATAASSMWTRYAIIDVTDGESPAIFDIDGDGTKDLVCSSKGSYGYASYAGSDPTKMWKFHIISENRGYHKFTHGMGIGDVNNDQRMDLLEKDGWWENPGKRDDTDTAKQWKFHPVTFSPNGGAQMFAIDIDGDGKNDVLTGLVAHGFGLSYFRRLDDHGDRFEKVDIMTKDPVTSPVGIAISQLHAMELGDINRDGLLDIVTGKRWWAHANKDDGNAMPATLVWLEMQRSAGRVQFVPHVVDISSGVGTQITIGDVNADGLLDIVSGTKRGTHLFLQLPTGAATRSPFVPGLAQKDPFGQRTAMTSVAIQDELGGYRPALAGNRPLNFDFESGDLTDWEGRGPVAAKLPTAGDTVRARRNDMVSAHQGAFWIGTFEGSNDDKLIGELISRPFMVTHPWASFLIGGGKHENACVEIVSEQSGNVLHRASGIESETMRRMIVDLKSWQGQVVRLRIVDHNQDPWGHVNFDDFRFHAQAPKLAHYQQQAQLDKIAHDRLNPEQAARAMTLPEGFQAQLYAGEPDVTQPVAMTIDHRGRLWVAEAFEYPARAQGDQGRDRIVIFEDSNLDGRFDNRKVFTEGLNLVSGLEVGFGGVWVGAAPYLYFIPDADANDVPDSSPKILLDGWGYQDTHETLNSFIWGPDGWLYGCHGVFTHSAVGKPGTAEADRTKINAGIWRYHPVQHRFEVFAHGTSNPWGVDFNDRGQCFLTACVIPHLYHIVQGGRYQRQAGKHFNPFTYDDIKTIAKHRHWIGDRPHSGNNRSDEAGGGHAHAGAMFYLGGSWPEKYRDQLFMNNIHGARINQDLISAHGSGYVGDRAPDFLLANDRSSQILYLRSGPDGQVYMIDWYDLQQCHLKDASKHDRTNGRIFRVSYGQAPAVAVDLSRSSDAELIAYQSHANDWFVRTARRLLQERSAAGKLTDLSRQNLTNLALNTTDARHRLRGLWALHCVGGIKEQTVLQALQDKDPYVRSWAIQIACQDSVPSQPITQQLTMMAANDPAPVVRLYLASACQRLPATTSIEIVSQLVSHREDSEDHNLPLMVWYAAETLVGDQSQYATRLLAQSQIDLVSRFIVRRVAALGTNSALNTLLAWAREQTPARVQMVLEEILVGLSDRPRIDEPTGWSAFRDFATAIGDVSVQDLLLQVAAVVGDSSAAEKLAAIASNSAVKATQRRAALESLRKLRHQDLAEVVAGLLDSDQLQLDALQAAAQCMNGTIAQRLLTHYAKMSPEAKRLSLFALASRIDSATTMLTGVRDKRIASTDLTADLIRQLTSLNDSHVNELVSQVWGKVRQLPQEKADRLQRMRAIVEASGVTAPSLDAGKLLFNKTCGQCHKLFGEGATIGPELTGADRGNLEYLLSNILDPSAVMAKDYQPHVILTDSGRVVTGLMTEENDSAVVLQTSTEKVTIYRKEIERMMQSEQSMMPENLLDNLSAAQIRDLIAYLRSKK